MIIPDGRLSVSERISKSVKDNGGPLDSHQVREALLLVKLAIEPHQEYLYHMTYHMTYAITVVSFNASYAHS